MGRFSDTKGHEKLAALIGRNVRALRGSLTQKDFAEIVGGQQGPISRYEAGKEVPGVEVLIKIARGCTTNNRLVTVGMLIDCEIKSYAPTPVKAVMAASVNPAPKPKAVKPPVDKVARKAAAKAAALDQPDMVKKPKQKKKAALTAIWPDDAAPETPRTEADNG